jgi:hypothetical protein
MHKVAIDQWRFDSEEEFSSDCPAGPAILNFAETEAKTDGIQWFYESGHANFKAGTAEATFTSYRTPEYAGFSLSVSASKAPDGNWKCAATKNTTKRPDAGSR